MSTSGRAITLPDIVPLGRSLAEYRAMFNLTQEELGLRVLGCGDGPASFNAELTEQGGRIFSIDPLYVHPPDAFAAKADDTIRRVTDAVEKARDGYHWDGAFRSAQELGAARRRTMQRFLADFRECPHGGRYIAAALPRLPFAEDAFDLALVSHLLFTYSDHLGREVHLESTRELLRVAREVRIFPLLKIDGSPSPLLDEVEELARSLGAQVGRAPVSTRVQKGAYEMLWMNR